MASHTELPGKLSADFVIPEDAVWFQGHFPGQPTLPGVAQIQLVLDSLSRAAAGRCYLRRLGRVRFKRMIRPREAIRVEVESAADRPDAYHFRLTVTGETACSGNLQVGWDEDEALTDPAPETP